MEGGTLTGLQKTLNITQADSVSGEIIFFMILGEGYYKIKKKLTVETLGEQKKKVQVYESHVCFLHVREFHNLRTDDVCVCVCVCVRVLTGLQEK